MVQIERVGAGKYNIIGLGKDRNTIAEVDTLEKAGCVLRFINGSSIKGDEYLLAIKIIREIDAKEKGESDVKALSGKTDNGIPDGSPSD